MAVDLAAAAVLLAPAARRTYNDDSHVRQDVRRHTKKKFAKVYRDRSTMMQHIF
jgi:hypothetical protein